MNYDTIIKNLGKYHLLLINKNKVGVLSSSNNLSEVKKMANEKILKKGDKLNDFLVILLKLKKISKKLLKLNEESKIKTIGGPIEIEILFNQIKKQKIKPLKDYVKNNKIYITNKFLKNNKLTKKELKFISILANTGKLNNKMYSLNVIDKFIK